ncbi:MAG: ATP-binding protein [Dehalococcoidales bacterium]|nr:ATP-binding protein [Dehalococcoidales bacterium]
MGAGHVWALEDTPAAEREISLIMDSNDDSIRISFADSGRGIEKGTEDMIFSPTFSTKRSSKGQLIGTGMGLSIVKTFVEDHANGNISVISPGRLSGAEFIITVPLKK